MPVPNLPLEDIVDVTVLISPQAPSQPTFNQGLIIGNSGVIPSQTTRLLKVTRLADLIAAGFATTDPEYLAASAYFSQSPPPLYGWIGAQDPTGLGTVTPHVANEGTGYVVGDVLGVTQGAASGGTVRVTTIGGGGAVTGVALVTSGTGYSAANGVATSGGTGSGAQLDITVGEPALQAVIACRDAKPDWYQFVCLTATDADHLALAAWAQTASPPVVYFYNTADADVLNAVPGNIAETMKTSLYDRVFGIYSTTQGGDFPNNVYASSAAMGANCGLTTGLANSYYTMKFKQLVGIAPEPLSLTQIATINGYNVNLYLNYAGAYNVLQEGKKPDGEFLDERVNLDILVSAIQFNVMNLLVGSPSIPQTDPGEVQLIQAVNQAADQAAQVGFIAGGTWRGVQIINLKPGDTLPKGYLAQAYPYSTQSQANREARQAMPIYLAIIEAGAVHFVTIGVYVQR